MSSFLIPSNVFRPFSSNRIFHSIFDDFDSLFGDAFFQPTWNWDPFMQTQRPEQPKSRLLMPRATKRKTHWSTAVDLSGFKPEEVHVKNEEGKLRILAKHEAGEDLNEIRKFVQIPDNVEKDKVETHLSKEGALVIRAPFTREALEKSGADTTVAVAKDWPWADVREVMREPAIRPIETHMENMADGNILFTAEVSVREFMPEEIQVCQIGDRVKIQAEHREEKNGQSQFRRMERTFTLPQGSDMTQVTSRLTENGCVRLEAPVDPNMIENVPRIIPIEAAKK